MGVWEYHEHCFKNLPKICRIRSTVQMCIRHRLCVHVHTYVRIHICSMYRDVHNNMGFGTVDASSARYSS